MKILKCLSKLLVSAAGFVLPYAEEYIRVKQQIPSLTDKISALIEENSKLKKENKALKRHVLMAAVIASASFVAFAVIVLIEIIE
jgi:cell division protein FtsB